MYKGKIEYVGDSVVCESVVCARCGCDIEGNSESYIEAINLLLISHSIPLMLYPHCSRSFRCRGLLYMAYSPCHQSRTVSTSLTQT